MAQSMGARTSASEIVRRGSETIAAMGMAQTLAARWQKTNNRYLAASSLVSDVVGAYGGISRAIRLLLQSSMLGVGAYLVTQQYDCRIGDAATVLSAGQRQRIALARALYGNPFLVVLDEPNANLDNEGEVALQTALRGLKARGAIAIIISHRPAVLEQCDKVLVLSNGAQQAFGPRDSIIRQSPARSPRPSTVSNVALLHEAKVDVGS
jgi:ABC-type protease/lipase transport system fused ATPase/permease subunit